MDLMFNVFDQPPTLGGAQIIMGLGSNMYMSPIFNHSEVDRCSRRLLGTIIRQVINQFQKNRVSFFR